MTRRISAVALLLLANIAAAPSAKITIDADKPGITVSPTLYGIFFEEINRAGDGGLYAEMVQNRSFEDVEDVPVAWDLAVDGESKASWTLDRNTPLNANNRTSVKLEVSSLPSPGKVALINRGFVGCPRNRGEEDEPYAERFAKAAAAESSRGHGIALRSGAEYLVSLYARSGDATTVTVTLQDSAGNPLASQQVTAIDKDWQKHEITLKPSADATDAKLVITPDAAGTYFLDMISMFPRDTFKGRAKGMRKDLAEMVVAMKPAFVRFPGGCFVEGEEIGDAARWKKTIGDLAERREHYNLWGYHSTNGLGMFEYLQFCEDINAEPLFVINCGMSHHAGRNNAYAVPMADMHEYVQDALDAIEYCNGSADSKWGALRAAAGHPKPFNLKYMEIGNENGGPRYRERYALFYDAIKAKHPDMHIIANVWEGLPTNRPYDLKDEHYYNSPSWFLTHADQYDGYDRKGAKVYVGEYAVTRGCGLGNLAAAVGEAAFMCGMERNSDVVTMASYAPLFARAPWKRWNPNAINFDSSRVYGTPSYHLQALFAKNRADVILPVKVEADEMSEAAPRGRIGIGTWDTQAEFKDIKVTAADGKTLWQFDPGKGVDQFDAITGDWKIVDGAMRQSSNDTPAQAFTGAKSWSDYTLTLKAHKLSGSEGFLISFHSTDPNSHNWWNLGGWGNRQHGLESPDLPQLKVNGAIDAGRWYDIKIELRGETVRCYLDGKKLQEATVTSSRRLIAVAGADRAAGETIVKVVNPASDAVESQIILTGVKSVASVARAIVLTSQKMEDENSIDQPDKIVPREQSINDAAPSFKHTFPPCSITVLRLKTSGGT